MQVRLLGPVDVMVDGSVRQLAGLRRKAVLAVLGLHPGESVSSDRIVDIVWGEQPPATVANALQNIVSYLRGVLGGRARIAGRAGGYTLALAAEAVDLGQAESLIGRVDRAADPALRAGRLRAALGLWRGGALADVAEVPWLGEQGRLVEQLRTDALEELVDARLALGEHVALIPELEQAVGRYPFRENVHRQLMLALYRSGRQADALAVYQRLRHSLIGELGIEPGPTLRELEVAILRQDVALAFPPPTGTPARSSVDRVSPAQLPLASRSFIGRVAELARLDSVVGTDAAAPATVVVVSGMAGVGKTTLAVHWAHRTAARFPDGQLYVNLRGFDPDRPALDPAEAIRGFLDAFATPPGQIPTGFDAQVGLYRSVLAGKRVLVVLDNARDADQVRPLLPGAAGCIALVTSRNELTSLVATEGAQPLALDLMSSAEAHALLARRLGTSRVAEEDEAVREIIVRCARLPVALAIAAARAATNPHLPLAALAAELRHEAGTLDALHAGDSSTDIRAVLSWSYQALTTDAATVFRLLGLHPGPDITLPAAASLTGFPDQRTHSALTALTRAYLLTEHSPGRYTFHDLLRAYAGEQGRLHDSAERRLAALHHVLDHYLHAAYAAALLLEPTRDPIEIAPPQPGVSPVKLESHDEAMAWFTTEHRVLLAAVEGATTAGFDTHTWQLAWALDTFLLRRGLWQEWATVQHTALNAAGRLDDQVGRWYVLRSLARAHTWLGHYDEADAIYRELLDMRRHPHDQVGRAHIILGLVKVAEQRGEFAAALSLAKQTLELYRAGGDQARWAHTLNGVGWLQAQLGDYHQALAHCQQALALLQQLDYRDSEARTWDSLGYIHRNLADYAQAANSYRQALELCRSLGDRYNEANALTGLGDTLHAAGKHDDARRVWALAMDILEQLGHPDAKLIRTRIGVPQVPVHGLGRTTCDSSTA